jgi:hypothetical protein
MQPSAGPWLSPKVVTLNISPMLLPGITTSILEAALYPTRSPSRQKHIKTLYRYRTIA